MKPPGPPITDDESVAQQDAERLRAIVRRLAWVLLFTSLPAIAPFTMAFAL